MSDQLATVDHILYVNAFFLAGLFFLKILTVIVYRHHPRLSTRRAQRRARPTTPFPKTWSTWATPKRPRLWQVTWSIAPSCTTTPSCLTTSRCSRPRRRTPCRVRWEVQQREERQFQHHCLVFSSPDLLVALQNQYRSDLNWMKGVGWETEGCMNIAQAKKAGELLSDVSMMLCVLGTYAVSLMNFVLDTQGFFSLSLLL